MKKRTRFEIKQRDRRNLWILKDRETGVNYILLNMGYGGCMTPLLDAEGKVVVDTPVSLEKELKSE